MKTMLDNNTLTLFLEGPIDTNNAAATEAEIFAAVEGKNEDIVLDAENLEYISSAGLLKKLHTIVPGKEAGLPERKQKMTEWVDSLSEFITEEEAAKIKGFIAAIPDRDTFLHGDYNAKNVMMKDNEFLLIDIGDAATGHPVFDIAGLMLCYIIIPSTRGGAKSDEELRGLLGFDFEYAQKVWGVMCGAYFGVSTPGEIGAITKKLMPYCLLMMTFQSTTTVGNNKEVKKMRVELVLRQRLLPAIETAQPLDF